jgi:NAD(P)-dependent dehydrogenase (short-subunit alcohol dehydrogenase family)
MAGNTFFILGGSSGIGLEIAGTLRSEGNNIFVGSRTAGQLDKIEGAQHVALDVSTDTFNLDGLPDVLNGMVYCPGSIRLKPFQRLTKQDFADDLQINFLGAVRTIQKCLSRLKKSSSGASIVLFSTVAATTGMPFHASIASAKAAVEGLTRSLAAEFAPRIRVNAIAPSLTDTQLAADLLSDESKRKAAEQRHPLKCIGSPGDIARLAVFLLSDAAKFVTGQIFHVDGGMSSLRTFR